MKEFAGVNPDETQQGVKEIQEAIMESQEGFAESLKSLRRPPYPMRQERGDDHLKSESFETLEESLEFPVTVEYGHTSLQQSASADSPEDYESSAERTAIYKKFFQELCGDGVRRPADCVVLSVNIQNVEYPQSIGQSLQERGLVVDMLYLQMESGLTRALQDVRSDGCPFCILVEQNNVSLSSCTVIIFSESLKIHRNMPQEQALDFLMVEFERWNGSRQEPEPNETAVRAAEMADDYLERLKLERHSIPSTTRHLLYLLGQGLHLYPEELTTLAEYIQNRQNHLQVCSRSRDRDATPVINSLPPGLGKPPPLLPASSRPASREQMNPPKVSATPPSGHHSGQTGSYPKTKPPPLLSIPNLKPPSHRPASSNSLLPSLIASELQESSFSTPSRTTSAFHSLDKPRPLFSSEHTLGFNAPSTQAPLLETPVGFKPSRGLLPHPGSVASRVTSLMRGITPANGPRAAPPQLRSLMGGPPGQHHTELLYAAVSEIFIRNLEPFARIGARKLVFLCVSLGQEPATQGLEWGLVIEVLAQISLKFLLRSEEGAPFSTERSAPICVPALQFSLVCLCALGISTAVWVRGRLAQSAGRPTDRDRVPTMLSMTTAEQLRRTAYTSTTDRRMLKINLNVVVSNRAPERTRDDGTSSRSRKRESSPSFFFRAAEFPRSSVFWPRSAVRSSLRDQSAPPPGPYSHILLLGHGYISSQAWLYYVCLRCSPASSRIGRRREDQ
ncbi:hypothetical protein DNTS_022081, partial [Danionella cerebrum]